MNKTKIIVIVLGGVVDAIITNLPVEIMLVDHDNIQEGDRPGRYTETVDPRLVSKTWARLRKGELPKEL
jgi:hypothetical protein